MLHYGASLGVEPAFDGAIVPVKTTGTPGPNHRKPTAFRDILDGTSNTFLVGETDFMARGVPTIDLGAVWAYGYIGYAWGTTSAKFNDHDVPTTASTYGAFRSQHPGGAQFGLADGSVRFVAETIEQTVYQAVSTRDRGETVLLP
jgi:prepilin-type processing-associated H-X9-DG protein